MNLNEFDGIDKCNYNWVWFMLIRIKVCIPFSISIQLAYQWLWISIFNIKWCMLPESNWMKAKPKAHQSLSRVQFYRWIGQLFVISYYSFSTWTIIVRIGKLRVANLIIQVFESQTQTQTQAQTQTKFQFKGRSWT